MTDKIKSVNELGCAEKDIITFVSSYSDVGIPNSELPKTRKAEQNILLRNGVLVELKLSGNIVISDEWKKPINNHRELSIPPKKKRLTLAKERLFID